MAQVNQLLQHQVEAQMDLNQFFQLSHQQVAEQAEVKLVLVAQVEMEAQEVER